MPNKTQKVNSIFPQLEENVLDFWEKNKIFEKSVERPAFRGEYVFYDGPPFATGLPHYGHIVASIMKDTVPRYWTMCGFKVERRWGWDCHGLPIENIVEKEMGSQKKKDIEKLGVDKFNELCRSKVLSYVEDWKKVIKRLGRWADMDNAYKTMDIDFMESVWWVFKELWDKGLIYKDYRSMHICPRCETTLSQSEVTEGYKTIKDLSCIAKFELEDEPNTYVLAWTTTPWTLIGNVALAVGKDIEYVVIKAKPKIQEERSKENDNIKKEGNYSEGSYIFAKDIFWRNMKSNAGLSEVRELVNGNREEIEKDIISNISFDDFAKKYNIKTIKGEDLIGKKYKPLFDYYYNDENLANRENGWKIYHGDFVTTEEGTGVVHIAPAFGEDDMNLGKKYNLPFIQHVEMDGSFKKEVKDFAGLNVKPAGDHKATDAKIIEKLDSRGLLFNDEEYEHSYPHCWRCDTPLLNYATSSWFVKVTAIKTRMLELAQNINWSPSHIKKGRFGKWLEGARDWSISRQRFWASVIPIWECEKCGEKKVIGSVKELEDLSGEKITDLHKHIVDKITFKCEKCDGTMRRVPDVLDCWFESGSMPYAQMHYPFENKEKFERNFPAEFIAEGQDQCRAWFYYLHVIGTGIKDSHAFKNVIVNGIVLAEDGKKMSKKLKNYPDPSLIFEKYGADAMRYYLLSSPVMMAENLNFSEEGVKEALRKVIMILWNVVRFYEMFKDESKVNEKLKVESSNVLDQWILARLEELTAKVTDSMNRYNLPAAVRPIGEFINDLSTWYIRRSRERFKGDDKKDKELALATTQYVLVELSKSMAPFTPFIAENVWQKVTGYNFSNPDKSVHLEEWPTTHNMEHITRNILKDMEIVRKIVELALARRDEAKIKVRQPLSKLKVKGLKLKLDDDYLVLIKDEVNVKEVEIEEGGTELEVELDTNITPELKQEGILRELVRLVNGLRKNASLTIEDKINIYWESESELIKTTIDKFKDNLLKETLAQEKINAKKDLPNNQQKQINIEDEGLWIGIEKI